jgi:hypothetical protein
MSMYTQLLEAGLESYRISNSQSTTGEALAELLRCRARLGVSPADQSGPVDVLGSVSDELAYDIALIAVTRGLGISCNVRGFEQPQHERQILEIELSEHGVHLDQLGGHMEPPMATP